MNTPQLPLFQPASMPRDEAARVATVRDYDVLDTPPEQAYDVLVRIAAQICGTPIALMSLLDEERQWFKARVGTDMAESPRAFAFCGQAILEPPFLEVPDLQQDARFASHPFVTGSPHIRFYAGAPLVAPSGHALGTLCALDTQPRRLSQEQREVLMALSQQAVAQLELRRRTRALEESQHRLRESEQRFLALVQHSPALTFLKDADGRMIYVNAAFERAFNVTLREVRGKTEDELWPPHIARAFRASDEVVKREGAVEIVEQMPGSRGDTRFWHIHKFAHDADGMMLAGVAIDVTVQHQLELALRDANERLGALATHDALTGLYNRRAFDARLNDEAARVLRHGGPLSLLIIDVDDFKAFNDTFGHLDGDETLQRVADLLAGEARAGDHVARFGGEEFTVILPDTDEAGAFALAERFRMAVQDAAWPHRAIMVSVGGATAQPAPDSSPDTVSFVQEMLARADNNLYLSKQNGRNCSTVYALHLPSAQNI